jgi:hypothetical protein
VGNVLTNVDVGANVCALSVKQARTANDVIKAAFAVCSYVFLLMLRFVPYPEGFVLQPCE